MASQLRSEIVVKTQLERVCIEYLKHQNKQIESISASVVSQDESLLTADIGGYMNHVHRVHIKLSDERSQCGDSGEMFSVIVKTATEEVKFLKELCGEEVTVDSRRMEYEAAALNKLYQIQPHSVPKVFLLDTHSKSIIMEDLAGFYKLKDRLWAGEVKVAISTLEKAMILIGKLHKSTWLDELNPEEKYSLMTQFNNTTMKKLKLEFTIDRPFNSSAKSNLCNPCLVKEIEQCRSDPNILSRVKTLRQSFLEQLDCLCHGDFSCDNILVKENEIRIVDMEFAGIGLRAYDIGFLLEIVIFHLFCNFHYGKLDNVKCLREVIYRAMSAYSCEVGEGCASACDSAFIEQVCGLIGCGQMWRVFGSYEIIEFGGDPEPERTLLLLAKSFLLSSDGSISVQKNVNGLLSKHGLVGVS